MGLENFKDFVKNPYCDSYDTISDTQPEGKYMILYQSQ